MLSCVALYCTYVLCETITDVAEQVFLLLFPCCQRQRQTETLRLLTTYALDKHGVYASFMRSFPAINLAEQIDGVVFAG